MAKDLENWLRVSAADHGFTLAEMLEHLVALESGLRSTDALGRRIRFRDTVYRQLTPPARAEKHPAGVTGCAICY
ncbi:MAG: hypothetical protein ABL864_11100 [Terricaulis sp.]